MSPWVTAMSRVTSHLGFGLTYASTFMHPFYTARLLNSLDHITNGRIAFNVITSLKARRLCQLWLRRIGRPRKPYNRLEEFIDVCRKFWNSVDMDAFVWNQETGQVADPSKIRAINHVGEFFKVKGPLSVVPSPKVNRSLFRPVAPPAGRERPRASPTTCSA